jgi:hypothetical protein
VQVTVWSGNVKCDSTGEVQIVDRTKKERKQERKKEG